MKAQQTLHRIAKYTAITLAILLGLGVAAFYSAPFIIKNQLPHWVEKETGRKTKLGKIDLTLMPLHLAVHDFVMLEPNGEPFVSFAKLTVIINVAESLTKSGLVVNRIDLEKPDVKIARKKNGDFNFKDLLKPADPKKPHAEMAFPVNVLKLDIIQGKFTWKDNYLPHPEHEELYPINLDVSHFNIRSKNPAELDLSLVLSSGTKLKWKGKLSVSPISSIGRITLEKINLERLRTLALYDLPFGIKGNGLIDMDYQFTKLNNDIKLLVKQSKIEFNDLQWLPPGTASLIAKIPALTLTSGFDLNLGKELNLTTDQTKLAVKNLEVTATEPEQLHLKIPELNLDGAYRLNQALKKITLTAAQNRLTLKDLEFIGAIAGTTRLKLPALSLAADYRLEQAENQLDLDIEQSKLLLQQVNLTTTEPSRLQVSSPAVNLDSNFQLRKAADKFNLTASNGVFGIKDIQLSELDRGKILIKVPEFLLKGLNLDLDKQQLNIASLSAQGADIVSWLDDKGRFNYQTLFAPPEHQTAPLKTPAKPAVTTPSPWQIQVNQVSLNDFGFNFEDRTLKKPVAITIKPINLESRGLSNKTGARLPFKLSMGVNQKGSVKLQGDAVLAPMNTKMDVAIANIDLEKFQPYVNRFARVDVVDGVFNAEGKLALAETRQNELDIKFRGNTRIADLLTRDQIKNKDFIKWENLSFKEVNADVLANRYTAGALIIHKPYARVVINKDKTVNFNELRVVQPASAATPVKTTVKAATTQPYFQLAKVQIIDGSSDFADLSLILPFAAQIKSLAGGASGISSEQKSTIKVQLSGNAYELAPVTIAGEISPYQGNYNIDLHFDGMPMPLISSYMVQFAGYKVEKGKLTLGLNYKVNGGQLTASNSILIDQFELGEKVENPNAVSVPLELAISLMKDSDGRIKIDVPISGSFEDPQFSISHIVVDALVNTITRVITSPFKALGSLVGSSEDLSTIEFPPGTAELKSAQQTKLHGLAKALKEKPDLNLDIKGLSSQEQDWPRLNDDALWDQLKRMRADEINKEGGRKIRPENVELSKDDYKRILADLFIQKFPLMAEKSLLGQPKLTDPSAGEFYEVAKQKLSDIIQPEQDRLKGLATERAKAIAKFMVKEGGIANERIYILDSAVDLPQQTKSAGSLLTLKVN